MKGNAVLDFMHLNSLFEKHRECNISFIYNGRDFK
jgi:hypothetical protein